VLSIQPEQISRYIVETSNEGVWIVDENMNTRFVSPRMAQMLGFAPEEIQNASIFDFIFEEDKPEFLRKLERRRNGIREEFDFRYKKKDGSALWAHVSTNPLLDESGKFVGAVGMFTDITERRKYQERLERSEERYRAFIEQSSEAIWRFEIDEPFEINLPVEEQIELIYKHAYLAECNVMMARQYGFESADELEGVRLSELLVSEDPKNYEFLKAFVESGYRLTGAESHEKDRQGNDRYFLNSLVGFVENGRAVRAWGTQRDITEQKLVEQTLRESEERYRALVEASAQTVWTADADDQMGGFARRFSQLIGKPFDEISRRDLLNSIHPEDQVYLQKVRNRIAKQPAAYEVEFRLRRENAPYRYYNLRGVPIFNSNGSLREWIGTLRDITDRKEGQIALRQSEESYRILAETASDAIIQIDEEGKIVFVNNAAETIFGYKNKELLGQPLTLLAPERAQGRHPADILNYIKTGKRNISLKSVEIAALHKSGRVFPLEISFSEYRRDEKTFFIGVGRDITERKKAEEQIRYQLALTETITDNTQSCLLMMDAGGRGTFANPATERITGFKPEELIGEILHYKIHHTRPDGSAFPMEECPLDNALPLQEAVVGYEDVFVHKTGYFYPVRCSGRPIFKDGKAVGTVIEVQDITEEKLAQEALLKAERKAAREYQDLLERIVPLGQTLGTARDLISVYRSVLGFVRSSMPCSAFFVSFFDERSSLRTAAYAWGEKGEVDISQLPPLELTEDGGGPNSQAVFQKKSIVVSRYMNLMKNRPHVILQEDGRDPNSSLVVPMIVSNRVIGTLETQAYQNDAFNREHIIALEMVANLAAVAVENVRLLQSEAEARLAAETANRAKDEFLSVLSHELRTPLNSMLGWIKMLRSGMLDGERSRQAVEVIERNTRLQNSLIEDLLDVSRIISGKMRIEKEEVDLVAVVRQTFETLRPSAEGKNIAFNFFTESESVLIEGDTTRLQQIIGNLIHNAVKFTPEGGKVSVTLTNSGDRARLKVKDTGIGIEKEVLPFIFERFRQADASTRRNFSGLGLGLTIVRNLVELHDGAITAESGGKNTGATFTVELPVARRQQRHGNGDALFQEYFDLKGAKILLVDDDADCVTALQMLLEKEKAEVVTVFSAEEALKKLTEQPFDILISDIGMPQMDGYDLIARIRRLTDGQNAFLPAVALTAYASEEDRRRALSAGFQMHFSKPFDFDRFLEAVIKLYKDSFHR
jgi:PAS domain S-box-containing protein